MSRRLLSTLPAVTRAFRPSATPLTSFRRSFALDSKHTASSTAASKTGQSAAGGANNQQAGSTTGINSNQGNQAAQKQTTAHSMGAAAGANTGDRPATSTPMSGTGTGHDQTQSMDSYARQADKNSKGKGEASRNTSAKTGIAGSANATSGDETMTSGTANNSGTGSSTGSGSSAGRSSKDDNITTGTGSTGNKATSSNSSTGSASGSGSGKSSTGRDSQMNPAGVSDSNVGSGGAIGSQGSPTLGGGGGGSSLPGVGSGTASMTDKAKEKIHELTGDVELPSASNYTVIAAVMVAVPVLFFLDPDYRFLKKEAKEQEKRIFDKYHSIA